MFEFSSWFVVNSNCFRFSETIQVKIEGLQPLTDLSAKTPHKSPTSILGLPSSIEETNAADESSDMEFHDAVEIKPEVEIQVNEQTKEISLVSSTTISLVKSIPSSPPISQTTTCITGKY